MKAKVRLVASGFSQGEGIDACETCAPRPSAARIRLLASIACEYDLDFCCVILMRSKLSYNLSLRRNIFSTCRKAVVRCLVGWCASTEACTAYAKQAERGTIVLLLP